jgi:fructuronate reductase
VSGDNVQRLGRALADGTGPVQAAASARPVPPIRIVHIGLGAFHRSHQAWYTQQADTDGAWGIAAFTVRSPQAAQELAAQDGLYTLVERSADGDTFELMSQIVQAHDGADLGTFRNLVAAPTTAVVTLTITEAGYHLGADNALDAEDPAVQADIAALRGLLSDQPAGSSAAAPHTPIGRLLVGLATRRDADAGPLAVVSCDNLADNAAAARSAVVGLAEAAQPELAQWVQGNVSFVGTSVDRITPRTTPADLALVQSTCGYADNAAVVTEPFRSWVLSGNFPAGRPRWEDAGATFVEHLEPFENRKLWLLNGAHSLLSYAGQLRGARTVAEALADPACAAWVEELWDEAERTLPDAGLDIPDYRQALLDRFANARIAHHLAQIASDATTKLRTRAVAVLKSERAAGRSGQGAARMIAAWVAFLRAGQRPQDPAEAAIASALQLDGEEQLRALLRLIDSGLAGDDGVVQLVERLATGLGGADADFRATTPAAAAAGSSQTPLVERPNASRPLKGMQ